MLCIQDTSTSNFISKQSFSSSDAEWENLILKIEVAHLKEAVTAFKRQLICLQKAPFASK